MKQGALAEAVLRECATSFVSDVMRTAMCDVSEDAMLVAEGDSDHATRMVGKHPALILEPSASPNNEDDEYDVESAMSSPTNLLLELGQSRAQDSDDEDRDDVLSLSSDDSWDGEVMQVVSMAMKKAKAVMVASVEIESDDESTMDESEAVHADVLSGFILAAEEHLSEEVSRCAATLDAEEGQAADTVMHHKTALRELPSPLGSPQVFGPTEPSRSTVAEEEASWEYLQLCVISPKRFHFVSSAEPQTSRAVPSVSTQPSPANASALAESAEDEVSLEKPAGEDRAEEPAPCAPVAAVTKERHATQVEPSELSTISTESACKNVATPKTDHAVQGTKLEPPDVKDIARKEEPHATDFGASKPPLPNDQADTDEAEEKTSNGEQSSPTWSRPVTPASRNKRLVFGAVSREPKTAVRPAPAEAAPASRHRSQSGSKHESSKRSKRQGQSKHKESAISFRLDDDDSGTECRGLRGLPAGARDSSLTRGYDALGAEVYSMQDNEDTSSFAPMSAPWSAPSPFSRNTSSQRLSSTRSFYCMSDQRPPSSSWSGNALRPASTSAMAMDLGAEFGASFVTSRSSTPMPRAHSSSSFRVTKQAPQKEARLLPSLSKSSSAGSIAWSVHMARGGERRTDRSVSRAVF